MEAATVKDSSVVFQTSAGIEIRATLLRLTRYLAVFEVYALGSNLRTSEILDEFRILLNGRPVYSGRAVVKGLVDTGLLVVCEASLEDNWIDLDFSFSGTRLKEEFQGLIEQWQKLYKVLPEYKVVVADLQTFLTDLRLWVEQVELGIRSSPSEDRLELERRLAEEISSSTFPFLDSLFERFEGVAASVQPDFRPVHCSYLHRQIHPLVLCAPFAFRTVQKPLGYAGDYEVVNMILRDPHEGGSLYAKVLNRWFLKQPPAEGHRNRIQYLTQMLIQETVRKSSQHQVARVFNLGCGPAREVQDFLAQNQVSNEAHFTLLDFNEETLAYAKTALEAAKTRHGRSTPIHLLKKSVAHLLKGKGKSTEGGLENQYDFVYCAGLFDYLTATACKQLMNIFYDMVAPGGLLVSTNVDAANPIRNWLGDILEWHLIYRNGQQMLALRPDRAPPENARVCADATGVNLFLEIRKPNS
jgi:extracellular factor (EF) 3-hydroxypalmitic acid methyl ester biosynthesis protein